MVTVAVAGRDAKRDCGPLTLLFFFKREQEEGPQAHHDLLRREVFEMWKEEGVTVGRLQDLIAAGVRLRTHPRHISNFLTLLILSFFYSKEVLLAFKKKPTYILS